MNDERKTKPSQKEITIDLANSVRVNRMAFVTKPPDGMVVGDDMVGTKTSERDDWNGVFFDKDVHLKESSGFVPEVKRNMTNSRGVVETNPNVHLVLLSKAKLANGFHPIIIFVRGKFPEHYDSRMERVKNINLEIYLEMNEDQISTFRSLGEDEGSFTDFLATCFPNMLDRDGEGVRTKYSIEESRVKIVES